METKTTCEIPVNGTGGLVTVIDIKYSEAVLKHSWCMGTYGYVICNVEMINGGRLNGRKRRTTLQLHRLIAKIAGLEGNIIDHIDGNKLNNSIKNLRVAGFLDNLANSKIRRSNTSGYKGVSFERGRWRARIGVGVKNVTRSLGYFDTAKEAAVAYNKALKQRTDIREEFKKYNEINN